LFKKIVVINVKNASANQMGANDRPLTETNFRKYMCINLQYILNIKKTRESKDTAWGEDCKQTDQITHTDLLPSGFTTNRSRKLCG